MDRGKTGCSVLAHGLQVDMKNVGHGLAGIGDAELAIGMFTELDDDNARNAAIDFFQAIDGLPQTGRSLFELIGHRVE